MASQAVSRVTTLGAVGGGGDLGAAAGIIADAARSLAASWSQKIPPSISLEVAGKVATISADAPDARPAELRLRHPLFGNREYWYGPPGAPFLAPAADAKAGAAMARYAKKIDGWARKAGFN
jgi:hypothetical protein